MLGLTLLAAHLVGDFVFQTRWQAGRKLVDHAHRARHVTAYTLPFVPIAAWRAAADGGPRWLPAPWLLFLALLWLLHYATDSRRFKSTLGDVIAWRATRGGWEYDTFLGLRCMRRTFEPLPSNPWEPLPILIDQALHVAQLAALGFLFA